MYTDADKDYIQGLGHTVVETPVGSQMITDTSLVFAIHFPLPDYLSCLSMALPAMLIGTGYNICEGYVAVIVLANLGTWSVLLLTMRLGFHSFQWIVIPPLLSSPFVQ